MPNTILRWKSQTSTTITQYSCSKNINKRTGHRCFYWSNGALSHRQHWCLNMHRCVYIHIHIWSYHLIHMSHTYIRIECVQTAVDILESTLGFLVFSADGIKIKSHVHSLPFTLEREVFCRLQLSVHYVDQYSPTTVGDGLFSCMVAWLVGLFVASSVVGRMCWTAIRNSFLYSHECKRESRQI